MIIQERWNLVGEYIFNNTSQNDIIFVGDYDYGFLGLKRRTFNIEFIPEKIRENEVKRVARSLLSNGYNVYVYRRRGSENETFSNFNIVNYTTIPYNDDSYEFYKLELK